MPSSQDVHPVYRQRPIPAPINFLLSFSPPVFIVGRLVWKAELNPNHQPTSLWPLTPLS